MTLADHLKAPLAERLLAMADDELILGHRDSEWCGHAPILEEDIAFANLAIDEQGHAAIWYRLHAEIVGESPETYPDKLAFLRPPAEFRNAPLVELPKGDWAFSMLRQYLFDAAELPLMERLVRSSHQPLADAAAKVQSEEFYHLRHTQLWVRRLGLGTVESHDRMQAAVDALWPYMLQYFEPLSGDAALTDVGIFPSHTDWQAGWEDQIIDFLEGANLALPKTFQPVEFSRANHTEHLTELLLEMQSVARLQPDAKW